MALPSKINPPWTLGQARAAINGLIDHLDQNGTPGPGGSGLVPDPDYPGYYVISEGGGDPGTPADYPPTITLGVSTDGLDATATFTATDPEGAQVTVSVSWGDGQTTDPATSPTTHTYATGGTYTVTATATAAGKTATDTADVTVAVVTTPTGYQAEVEATSPVVFLPLSSPTNTFVDTQGVATVTVKGGNDKPAVYEQHPLGAITGSVVFASNTTEATYLDLGEPAALEGMTAWSMSWVAEYVTLLVGTAKGGMSRGADGAGRWRAGYINVGDGAYRYYQSTPTAVSAYTTTSPGTNTPRHYAITYDGTEIKQYLDGALVHTFSTTGAGLPTISGKKWRFGHAEGQDLANQFRGWVAGIAIHNRALTATEVADLSAAAGIGA